MECDGEKLLDGEDVNVDELLSLLEDVPDIVGDGDALGDFEGLEVPEKEAENVADLELDIELEKEVEVEILKLPLSLGEEDADGDSDVDEELENEPLVVVESEGVELSLPL